MAQDWQRQHYDIVALHLLEYKVEQGKSFLVVRQVLFVLFLIGHFRDIWTPENAAELGMKVRFWIYFCFNFHTADAKFDTSLARPNIPMNDVVSGWFSSIKCRTAWRVFALLAEHYTVSLDLSVHETKIDQSSEPSNSWNLSIIKRRELSLLNTRGLNG